MVKNNLNNNVREVKKGFKIITIGNSQGVLIDKNVLEYLDIKLGEWVEITIKKPDNNKKDLKSEFQLKK